jgi:peptide/nickel transport system substrate-binding protein
MKRKDFIVLFLVTAVFFAGCIGQKPAVPEKQGGTLIFARSGDAVKLDPADVEDGISIDVCSNIYDSLLRFKEGTAEVEPALATSWQSSSDGLVWTFKLRQGVKFHDGTDFKADAVVFSLMRQADKNHPYFKYGQWPYWTYMYTTISNVEAVDDYTVKITLSEPYAPFLTNMAVFTVAIVSPTAYKKDPDNFFKNPVGTGPFKFVEWVKDDHVTLAAFDEYWDGRPFLDQLIWKTIPEASIRLAELEKGTITGYFGVSPDDISKIRNNPNLQLLSAPGLNVGYLAMNTEKKPFGDKRIRQAINYAINKKDIVDNLYRGTGQVAKNPMPPTLWGYNDAIQDYPYDPVKAKALLAEAGYPNGFKTKLWVMPVVRPYMFDPPKIGEAIQSYLKAVGIEAEIVQYDWGTYLSKTASGEHEMCLLGWTGDNGDPDNFLYIHFHSSQAVPPAGNRAFFKNAQVDDLLIKAQRTYDQAQRAKYYEEAQVILHEEAPWVCIAHATDFEAFQKNVNGFVISPLGIRWFNKVWLTKTPAYAESSMVNLPTLAFVALLGIFLLRKNF